MGVRQVFQTEHGIAVVANGFWAAMKGRDAIQAKWDEGPLAGLDSRGYRKTVHRSRGEAGTGRRGRPRDRDVDAGLKKANKTIEAEYHAPFIAHAAIEPMNCAVDLRAG